MSQASEWVVLFFFSLLLSSLLFFSYLLYGIWIESNWVRVRIELQRQRFHFSTLFIHIFLSKRRWLNLNQLCWIQFIPVLVSVIIIADVYCTLPDMIWRLCIDWPTDFFVIFPYLLLDGRLIISSKSFFSNFEILTEFFPFLLPFPFSWSITSYYFILYLLFYFGIFYIDIYFCL